MVNHNKTIIELLNLAKLHNNLAKGQKEGSRKALKENWSASALYYALSKLYVMNEDESENYKSLSRQSYLGFIQQIETKYENKFNTDLELYKKEFNELSERVIGLALENQDLRKRLSDLIKEK